MSERNAAPDQQQALSQTIERAVATKLGPISIRRIRESDAEAFRALRLDAFQRHADIFYGADYQQSLRQPIAFWQAQARRNASGSAAIMFVAEADRELVGVLALERDDAQPFRHNGRIWHIYIHPSKRGLRLADALIDTCVSWARAEGIRTLRLAVGAENSPAIRCYARCGFSIYGIQQEIGYRRGDYVDELLMARKIA